MLIKTVKAKKLPNQALKTIASRFKLNDGQIELTLPVEDLKKEAATTFEAYINDN